MAPEFGFSDYPAPRNIPIETLTSPYRQDLSHVPTILEVERKIASASKRILFYWETLRNRIATEMFAAKDGEEHIVTFMTNGQMRFYQLQYVGDEWDYLGRPTSNFRLVNLDEEGKVNFISIATPTGPNFNSLASLTFHNRAPVEQEHFHFNGKELEVVSQVSRPQVLYPTSPKPDERQFLWIRFSLSPIIGLPTLRVDAGFSDDEGPAYSYENYGGDMVKDQSLKLVGGDAQLIDATEEGTTVWFDFNLARAIDNMSTFKVATAP